MSGGGIRSVRPRRRGRRRRGRGRGGIVATAIVMPFAVDDSLVQVGEEIEQAPREIETAIRASRALYKQMSEGTGEVIL
jgi:hypothetical protein